MRVCGLMKAIQLSNSRLVLIEGDHFIAGKNPEMFNKAVEEFLLS